MTLDGVSAYTEEANQQCRALAAFFRRRQEIELEYGTAMANLCMEYKRSSWGDMTPENRALFSNTDSRFGLRAQLLGLSHWRGVFEAVTMCAGVAETHVQFAVNVQRAVIDPLQCQIREMESMRQAHLDLGTHLSRQLQDAYTEYRVAKQEHDTALAAKNDLTDQLSKAQLNSNTKKKDVEKLAAKTAQATERYDVAVRRLADSEVHRSEAQSDYFLSRIPALQMDICNYEEKRLDILRNTLTEVFHLEQMSYSTRAVWTKATDDLVSSMDQAGDIGVFRDLYCGNDAIDVSLVSVRSLVNPAKAGRVQLKRGDNNPDWVNQYFVVMPDDGGGLLYIFDGEDSEKPTEVIKLAGCSVYSVDDSFFGLPNCLQLIISSEVETGTTYNFLTESPIDKQEWQAELRKLCKGCEKCGEMMQNMNASEPRSMRLWIVEAKDLPAKSNPFCVVLLNDVKQARTQVRNSESPFWGEEFSFNDIPPCRSRLRLLFFSHQQGKARDQEIGYVSINLTTIKPGKRAEEWSHIISFTPEKTIVGSVRLAYVLSNDTSLPLEGYDHFVSLMTDPDLSAVRYLSKSLGTEREEFCKILVNMLISRGNDIQGLKVLAREEIQNTEDANIIFRGNSIASKALDSYMKRIALPFLRECIGSLIKGVYQTKDSCEVDPLRMAKGDDAKKNFKRLSNHVQLFWDAILTNANKCPIELRSIFNDMADACNAKFNSKKSKYAAISGFVFLRFFCPAILNPKLFGIMPDHPDAATGRTLTLVAKIIQNLANLTEFEGKEPHMQIFNDWIEERIPDMIGYIDTISEVPSENVLATPRPRINVRQEASTLLTLMKSKWEVYGPLLENGPESVRELKPVIENLDAISSMKPNTAGSSSNEVEVEVFVSSRRPSTAGVLDTPQLPPLDLYRDNTQVNGNSLTLKKSRPSNTTDIHIGTPNSGFARFFDDGEDDLQFSSSFTGRLTTASSQHDDMGKKKGWRESLLRKNGSVTQQQQASSTLIVGSPELSSLQRSSTALSEAIETDSAEFSNPSLSDTKIVSTTPKISHKNRGGFAGKLRGLLSKQDGQDSNGSASTSQVFLPVQ